MPLNSVRWVGGRKQRTPQVLVLAGFISTRATGLEPATSGSTVPFLRVVNPNPISTLRQSADPVAVPVAVTAKSEGGNDDPDLSRLIAAWPTLPEPIRRAMLAILEAAT